MRIPWRNPAENTRTPKQPPRLPQRWVVILGLAGVMGVMLGTASNAGTGLTVGLTIVALLHSVMD